MCDLCWSDPNAELPDKGWADSDRGAGYLFGQVGQDPLHSLGAFFTSISRQR